MQETVTYSLKLKEPNSEPYYRRVREFTDVVIDRAAPLLLPAVAEFTDYIRTFRLEVKGLTKEALMGELDPLNTLPAYQLGLPFSRQAWRESTICGDLSGTTL